MKLEQKNKECDELKELYIQLRASKDIMYKQLQSEKDNNDNINSQLKSLTSELNDYKSRLKMKDDLLLRNKTEKEKLECELNNLKNDGNNNKYVSEVCLMISRIAFFFE